MKNSWTVTVNDEGIIEIPSDLLKITGWKIGDILCWIDNHDGSWSLIKEDLTQFILNRKN